MGAAYQKEGNLEMARISYEKALQANPQQHVAKGNLPLVLRALQK